MAVLSALAVWIAFVNVPAHAFQEVQPSPDASGTGPNVGWYQPGYPHTNEPDPTDPQLDKAAAMVLPDLRTLPPSDLRIQILSEGRRSLRLANTIWNSGKGPLELTGEFNAATQRTRVHQHIYTADGNQREFLVGEFVWHPTHDHWHFDELTIYELWTLKQDYSLGKVVASSDKLSYCLMDTDVIDRDNPRFVPRRGYGGCGQREQGLSVGWGDTYKATFDGQALDLTGLPDGFYALTSSVNPNAVIIEEDYTNNSARVYLAIWGERLNVVTLKQIKMAECGEFYCQ